MFLDYGVNGLESKDDIYLATNDPISLADFTVISAAVAWVYDYAPSSLVSLRFLYMIYLWGYDDDWNTVSRVRAK